MNWSLGRPWERAGANWSLGRPWEASGGLGLGSQLERTGASGGLGRPRALGASWSELEPREALGTNWSLGRPWEASALGSELERGARCEPPGETFTTWYFQEGKMLEDTCFPKSIS